MSIKKLSAGDIIEARCTRCRDILNHRIVAMVEEKIVRVECNTCGGVHNYHAPPEPKGARTPRVAAPRAASAAARIPKKDPGEADREEWAALQESFDQARIQPYDMEAAYRTGHLIRHPSFGVGVVKAVAAPRKIQVLFKDGMKLLRCG